MPKKFAKKKTFKRRAFKRKRYGGIPTMVSNNSISPFAPRFLTKHKYADTLTLSSTAAVGPVAQMFRLNSLYDPDFTNTGHQPYGFDYFVPLYTRYRVFAVDYKFTFSPNGTQGFVYVATTNDETSLTATSQSFLTEMPMCKNKIMSYEDPCSISGHISLPKLTGVTPAVYKTSDRYTSTVTTNPSELMSLQVLYSCPHASTYMMRYNVEITYHTEWFDPVRLVQS